MASTSAGPDRIRAYTIRGYLGAIFSRGMDTLAARLNALGVVCTVHPEAGPLGWPYGNVGALTAEAAKSARQGFRLVLIGHSMGGDAALRIAQNLEKKKIAVPLVVCFDPTRFGAPAIPANVGRAICFYQRVDPIGGSKITPGPGFRGTLVQEKHNQLHSRLDDDPALHARVLAEISKLKER